MKDFKIHLLFFLLFLLLSLIGFLCAIWLHSTKSTWAFVIPMIIGLFMFILSFPLKTQWRCYRSKSRRRTKGLDQWAKSKGLSFSTKEIKKLSKTTAKNYRTCTRCSTYDCYAYNVTSGMLKNRRICAFDYHCSACNYKSLSIVTIEADLKLEPLYIRPHCLIEKNIDSAKIRNIDFESAEFNSEFHIYSPDRRWAYDVINQSNMELLLCSCRFNIEFLEKHVIAYRNELFDLGYFEEALQLLTGILDNIPESVVKELKGGK